MYDYKLEHYRIQCLSVGEADLEIWAVGYDLYTLR